MKKEYIIGAVALAFIGGFFWWKSKKSNSISSSNKLISSTEKDALMKEFKDKYIPLIQNNWANDGKSPKRLINTINAGLMSTSELQAIKDAADDYYGDYIGTKTSDEIHAAYQLVICKYDPDSCKKNHP